MLTLNPFHGTVSSRYDPASGVRAEMRRREFIGLLGGAAAARPLAGHAQERGRVYRIGGLHQSPADAPQHLAFFDELQTLGFLEGHNLSVERRFAELAQDQVKAQLDAILCGGEAAARAAQRATRTIPLVVLVDVIRAGLVHSLAKPGGNTTGVSILASELDGKRQDILIEAVPGPRKMAALVDPGSTTVAQAHALVDSARMRGVQLSIHQSPGARTWRLPSTQPGRQAVAALPARRRPRFQTVPGKCRAAGRSPKCAPL